VTPFQLDHEQNRRILKSKRAHHVGLAALLLVEKLVVLAKLRARSLAIAAN